MIDWALAYAACGWRVFPAVRGGKRPLREGWQADATTDPARIAQDFADPRRNLAAVAGEAFDLFDVEAEHLAALAAHMDRLGVTWPDTPHARSGRGGIHLYTAPTGTGGNRRLFLDGVRIGDTRSTGGLAILPPSVTEGQYAWIVARSGLPVAPAPDWLLALVQRPAARPAVPRTPWRTVSLAPRADLAPLVRHVGAAPVGNRNAALHWAACRAADDGVPPNLAEAELLAAFMGRRLGNENPAGHERSGLATIRSAYSRA